MVERGVMGVVSVTTAEQRSTLIRSYGNLYAQSRIETLECLDKLQGLRDADELKSKLLFSVVVVSFHFVCPQFQCITVQRLNLQRVVGSWPSDRCKLLRLR